MHDQPYSLCVCSVAVLRWRQSVARARKLHLSRRRVCQWLILFYEWHCHLWSKTEQTHGIEKSISLDTRNRKAKGNKITNQFLTAGMLDRTISTLLSIFKVVRLQSFCTLLTYSWLTSFDSRFMISWRTKQSLAKGTLERIQRHPAQCDDVIILPWGIKTNVLSKSSNSHSKCILESTRFNGLFWKFRFQKTINLDKREWLVSSLCSDEVTTAFFSLSGRDINEIHLRIWLMWKTFGSNDKHNNGNHYQIVQMRYCFILSVIG